MGWNVQSYDCMLSSLPTLHIFSKVTNLCLAFLTFDFSYKYYSRFLEIPFCSYLIMLDCWMISCPAESASCKALLPCLSFYSTCLSFSGKYVVVADTTHYTVNIYILVMHLSNSQLVPLSIVAYMEWQNQNCVKTSWTCCQARLSPSASPSWSWALALFPAFPHHPTPLHSRKS